MTPKEKANELFSRYYVMLLKTDSDISEEITISLLSKQCALIAVDEIIDALDKSLINADIEWWKEVKQEIKKI